MVGWGRGEVAVMVVVVMHVCVVVARTRNDCTQRVDRKGREKQKRKKVEEKKKKNVIMQCTTFYPSKRLWTATGLL